MEQLKKMYSVAEIARIYGFKDEAVRDMCHARGEKFAYQLNGGKWYIDLKKFKAYLERKRREKG